jgi:hypothetical protein
MKAFEFHAAEHKLNVNVDKEKLKTVPCHARKQSNHLSREGRIPGSSGFSGSLPSRGLDES